MSGPYDVTCPSCYAKPGERCDTEGGATHDARVAHAKNRQRELRPYDVEPTPVPEQYQHEQPPGPELVGGRLAHKLDDGTRASGLRNLERIRAEMAARAVKRGGVIGAARPIDDHFAQAAREASARWHDAGCPEPQHLHVDGDDAA
jgi:hypothetical protein